MNDLRQALVRAWAVLDRPAAGFPMSSFPLPLDMPAGVARVAVDDEGLRHLLVPDHDPVTVDGRPSVLGVTQVTMRFGDELTTYVDVVCNAPDLHAEFDDLVLDILDSVAGNPSPGRETVRVIARWRRLFLSRIERGLSPLERLGLFAELTVLRALRLHRPDLHAEVWRGPFKDCHDFELSGVCLEVKALGQDSDKIVVHGLDQLEPHDQRPLHVLLLTVVQDPDGISLGALAQDVIEIFGDDRSLSTAFTKARLEPRSGALALDTYSISAVVDVDIGSEVPRLVPSGLVTGEPPRGVSDVVYSVALADLLPHGVVRGLDQVAQAYA